MFSGTIELLKSRPNCRDSGRAERVTQQVRKALAAIGLTVRDNL